MEYCIISISTSLAVANTQLNQYAERGWTVHTATQSYILLERKR